MSDAVLILSTARSRDQAERIADALLAERLAACVQLTPIESRYRWQGAIERATEIQLQIKTRAALAQAVEDQIRVLHDYEVPEVVVLPITGGSLVYLDWIAAETVPVAGS